MVHFDVEHNLRIKGISGRKSDYNLHQRKLRKLRAATSLKWCVSGHVTFIIWIKNSISRKKPPPSTGPRMPAAAESSKLENIWNGIRILRVYVIQHEPRIVRRFSDVVTDKYRRLRCYQLSGFASRSL